MVRKILAVMLAGSLALVVVPVQAEEEPYEVSKRYIGGSFLWTHFYTCGILFNIGDYTPYDCIGGAKFNEFPTVAEYQITINDKMSDSVGGYWTYCTGGSCPATLFEFCDSTTLYATPEYTVHVRLYDPALNTLMCESPNAAVEGTITMRQISE